MTKMKMRRHQRSGEPRQGRPRTSFFQKTGLLLLGVFLTLVCLELGMRIAGWVILSCQEHRNVRAIQRKGTYRIMCLGESTTQGQYPSFLEKELNSRDIGVQFSVIDKGIGGTDTSFILFNLEGYLDQYQPDMVVAMMGVNDFNRFLKADLEQDSSRKTFLSSFKVYRLARFVARHLESKFGGEERAKALALDQLYARPVSAGPLPSLKQIVAEDADLRKAVETQPGDPRVFIDQARRYIDEGKGAEAEQLIREAIRLQPQNSDYYIELSLFYERVSRIGEAEQALLQAPNRDARVYLALARLYGKLRKEDKEEDVLRQAASIPAARPLDWPHSELASLYLDQGRIEEAEAEAHLALELNPKNNWALVKLAKIYSRKGDYQRAEKLMAKAAAVIRQDQWFVLYQQAEMFDNHGKKEEALRAAEKSLALKPDNMEALGFLYYYYRRVTGDLGKAEEMLQRAVATKSPLSLWAVGEMASLRYEQNDQEYVQRFRTDYWEGQKHPRKYVFYQPLTRQNFRKMKTILDRRGIVLVVVQYPTRELKPLKDIFAGEDNVFFVDNEKIFRDAVMQDGFNVYFGDMFAGDFGHCTDAGNQLLAENISDTILNEVFNRRDDPVRKNLWSGRK